MELKQLVGRNVSAGLREVMNARMAALHSQDGEVPHEVIKKLLTVEDILEDVQEILLTKRT